MAEKKVVIITADTSKAEKEVKDLGKTIENTTSKAEKSTEALGKTTKNTGKSVKLLSNGFRTLGTAIKATGIGLLIGLVAGLTKAFSNNKEVTEAVSGVFNGIGIIFNKVSTALIDAYKAVNDATGGFDALGKVLSGLLTIAVTPLKVAFFGIKLAIQQTQLAWEKSFFGDKDPTTIKELNKAILETQTALVEVGKKALDAGSDIVNNFSEAISEVGSLGGAVVDNISKIDIKASLAQGKALAQSRNNALLAQASIQGLIEKYDRLAEEQRQIRDDERLSINERIEANNELGRILEEQLKQQKRLAEQRVAAASFEIQAGNNSIENQVALKEALNEVAAVEAQVTGFKSEQRVNEAALQKERLENINELRKIGLEEQELKELEIEQEFERRQRLIENTAENETQLTELLVAAQIDRDEQLQELKDIQAEKDKQAKDKKDAEDAKRLDDEAKREQALADYKIQTGQNVLSALSNIAKEGSKGAKAIAVAQAILSTYQGINKALAETTDFTPTQSLRFANAIAVGVAGFANVKKILSTNATGSGGGGGSVSAGGASAPATPQFNLVGQDSTNVLAQTISGQQQQPVQAYVVSNDVTDAQSLENNIVGNASIG